MLSTATLMPGSDQQVSPIKLLESSVIEHPRFRAAKTRALKLPSRALLGLEARLQTITGNPGAGKTTLLRSLANDLQEDRDGRVIRHGVYFQTPKLPTWRSLASAMMASVDPNFRIPKPWNSTDVIHALKPVVRAKEVTLWLGDEGHRLVSRRSNDVRRDTADFIVQVLNELGISLVMAGLSNLMHIVRVDQVEDGVLGRRRDSHYHLAAYNWADVHGRAYFLGFLDHLQRRIMLPKASPISDEGYAARLFVASCGQPGLVVKLISEALTRALDGALDCIDLPLLADVYSDFVFGDDADDELPDTIDFKIKHEQLAMLSEPGKIDPYLHRKLPHSANPFACDVDTLSLIWLDYSKMGLSPMSGKVIRAPA